jgi:gliding motility-associated-like protein
MTLIDMFAHATKILNTNSHPAAELRGIYSIKSLLKLFSNKITSKMVAPLFVILIGYTGTLHATHAEGADITYKCLGGNQYEIFLSFYRDCQGISAPSSPTISFNSSSTNQNFKLTLQPIPGTGKEISPVCSSLITLCSGGTYPGVQEWVYSTIVTLSPAKDWVFSYGLCCRNAAITTIFDPGNQNIYIESTLNNLDFPCNSSPIFSIKPIPFLCLGQEFSFNHGASDIDGDYISYELVTPKHNATTLITYLSPYTPNQPLSSSPAVNFDTVTGTINMTPSAMEVTILAVKVKQWKNNTLVGYVIRDIQLRVISCNNSYPFSSGINGSGSNKTSVCVGSSLTFDIYTHDADPNQNLTLSWNNGIPGASFTITGGSKPVGTFSWTPTLSDTGMHYFMITIKDDNCPINGSKMYSIGIKVNPIDATVSSTNTSCGASNGTATITPTLGAAPYQYFWPSCGCITASIKNLHAGSYTAIVTDAKGCQIEKTIVVGAGAASGNIIINASNASCFNYKNGTATATVNGGNAPYTYLWSTNETTKAISGLAAGTYSVLVTTANGCTKSESITITQPSTILTSILHSDATCYGNANGLASASSTGGTLPYVYSWNTGKTSASISGLKTGNYFVVVTDAKGCSNTQNVLINEPSKLTGSLSALANVLCYNGNNGLASVTALGGTAPYSYLWTNGQTAQTNTTLNAGTHTVTITDSLGCPSTLTLSVTQPSSITYSNNSQPATCYGMSNGSASVNFSGGTPSYSYLWSNGSTTGSISNVPAGNYSVKVSDYNGCTQTASVTISQPAALAQTNLSIQHATCNNESNGSASLIISGGVAPYTYGWSSGHSTSTATMLAAGNYSIVTTDANGCTLHTVVSILQPNAIGLVFAPKDTICPGVPTAVSVTASGGTPPFTYYWGSSIVGNELIVSPTITTAYHASIIDANGCNTKGTANVNVYLSNIDLVANATPAICVGNSATLSAKAFGHVITHYTWSGNLGNGAGPYIVSPATTTTYSVMVTDMCGITKIAGTTVKVNPLPEVRLLPTTGAACDKIEMKFSNSISGNNATTYSWDFGDGQFSSQENPIHTYTTSGNYTVSLTATSNEGCSAKATSTCDIKITPTPVADFTINPSLSVSIINPSFHFFDESTHATSWNWSFGDSSTSKEKNPNHLYDKPGIYFVKLITLNAGGCIDSVMKTVEVKNEYQFYLPNTFSPNGNNVNDNFTGKGDAIAEFHMEIYDRWGNKIFETTDLATGWDGRVNGSTEIAQQDIYVYKIEVKDTINYTTHRYSGNVNLIR